MYKLTPATKDYLWGGEKLRDYGIEGKSPLAEAWVLSLHKDGESLVEGKPLSAILTKEDIGVNASKFPFFPVLIKLIDAKQNLSVQVHPSDDYALKHENSFGKTEMWYVLDAEENAGLFVGFKDELTKEEYANSIQDGTITSKLNFFKVKPGDCFFIEAGTVHAIGAGCLIAEVQQNSNLTYRVFDFNRKDAQGNSRPLHIEKAKLVSCLKPFVKTELEDCLARCKYFTVTKKRTLGQVYNDKSFTSLLVVSGNGKVNGLPAKKGDSFYILPKERIEYSPLSADFEILLTSV